LEHGRSGEGGAPAPRDRTPADRLRRLRLEFRIRIANDDHLDDDVTVGRPACAAISISGPAGSLAGRSVSFTLPPGTTVTQQWNGTFSATDRTITVQLPSWATTDGATYDSSGFCVAGTGDPSGAKIH
jgi:hypothetical protein